MFTIEMDTFGMANVFLGRKIKTFEYASQLSDFYEKYKCQNRKQHNKREKEREDRKKLKQVMNIR